MVFFCSNEGLTGAMFDSILYITVRQFGEGTDGILDTHSRSNRGVR